MTEPQYPHMFVPADGRLAEDLCAVELLDSPTVERARELAEIHQDHSLDECLVLRAALAVLRAETPAAPERNHRFEKGFPSPAIAGYIFFAHYCEARPGRGRPSGATPSGGGDGD